MRVDVVVRGDREAVALLERLRGRLADGRPQLLGLVDQLLGIHRERFAGRGVRWKRVARSTLRRDARGGRDPRLMVESGGLLDSLTKRGAPGQIVRVSPTQLTFGTRVWLAKFHHRGQGVPRRPLVGVTRAQRRRLVDELSHLLTEGL